MPERTDEDLLKYNDAVFTQLERMGLPDYVGHFKPEDVANTYSPIIYAFWKLDLSFRFCALCIFGGTWNKIKNNVNIDYGGQKPS